jgi:hypothetical protein
MSNHGHPPACGPIPTHMGRIPSLSEQQLLQAVTWSLTRLPYRMTIALSDRILATVHLRSGRSISLEPRIHVTDDSVALEVVIGEVAEQDVPEILAIHDELTTGVLHAARVIYARASAAA